MIAQQGVEFTWQADPSAAGFDAHARPAKVRRSSTLGYSRTDLTQYDNNTTLWVLGQLASITEVNTSQVVESHTYAGTTALRTASFAYGLLRNSYAYNADGTLSVLYDGAGRPTVFQNYMRGQPQRAVFADQSVASRVVNNLGRVASYTNEAGTTTIYGYDAMGPLASISYPSEPQGPYNVTTLTFAPDYTNESGLGSGHWRQTITTGAGTVTQLFDALWRKRVAYKSISGTVVSAQLFHYDADGREIFQAYPLATQPFITDTPPGKGTTYDALGRAVQRYADTELVPARRFATNSYLGSFQTQTTDFNGNVSTSSFQAFDWPTEDALVRLDAPQDLHQIIARDIFGKPLSITRYGTDGGATTSVTRSYVYDGYQRLCKTIEPELGATLQDWDAAGNLAWRSGGTSLTTSTCDRGSVTAAQRISFGYDARNRLASTTYGDGSPGVTRSYWVDGMPYQTISNGSTWTYAYNNRRLPTSETLTFGGRNSLSAGSTTPMATSRS